MIRSAWTIPLLKPAGFIISVSYTHLECEDKSAELRIGSKQFCPRLTICKMDMKPVETAYMIDFMIELEDETEAGFTLNAESRF